MSGNAPFCGDFLHDAPDSLVFTGDRSFKAKEKGGYCSTKGHHGVLDFFYRQLKIQRCPSLGVAIHLKTIDGLFCLYFLEIDE